MRLTVFTDYALRALIRLAGDPERSFSTNDMASRIRGIAPSSHQGRAQSRRRGICDHAPRRWRRLSAGEIAGVHHSGRGGARTRETPCAGRMLQDGWRELRSDPALSPQTQAGRCRGSFHAIARCGDGCGVRLSRRADQEGSQRTNQSQSRSRTQLIQANRIWRRVYLR